MKTYIKNGKKFIVNDELYSKLKKNRIYEANVSSNPANPNTGNIENPINSQNNNNQQNTQNEVQNAPQNQQNQEVINNEVYNKIVNVVETKLSDKFNGDFIKSKYGYQGDVVRNYISHLFNCLKTNRDEIISMLNEQGITPRNAVVTIVDWYIKDDLNNENSSIASRLGAYNAKELYTEINNTLKSTTLNTTEERQDFLSKEYDKICNAILDKENPEGKNIYDLDVTKYVENIYKILGKDINSSDFKQQLEATVKYSLFDDNDGVQAILKKNKTEICNNIIRQKQQWNGEFLEDVIRSNLLKTLTSEQYVNAVINKLVDKNKDIKDVNKLKTAVKGYLTALASDNYNHQDTSDENKNEVSMLEKMNVGYVSYIAVHDNGGLIDLEDIKNNTKDNEENNSKPEETKVLYLDSSGKKKKSVPVIKGNPVKKLVLPTSEYYDFSIEGTELVFKKTEKGRKAEETDEYNMSQLKSKAEQNLKSVHDSVRDIAKMRENIKDCIINFVNDNKDFFGDYKIVAIVFDNNQHKNPIDEFIIDLNKKETLRFHSLPPILESVKKDGDEIVDLNPIIVSAFKLWRNYIEDHNSKKSDSFDTPEMYNNVVDKITNKLSSLYNLYMNTRNINDTTDISEKVSSIIDKLNESDTIEYCKQLLLCISGTTRNSSDLEKILSEAKKDNKKSSKKETNKDNTAVKEIFDEMKALKKLYNIDRDQYYEVYSELSKMMEAAEKNGFENDVKKLVNAITDLFAIKQVTGKLTGSRYKSSGNLYARYFSYMLTKVLKITLDNDIHNRYDRLSDRDKSEFNKNMSKEYGKTPGEESADEILENYLYYTDEYPTEGDVSKYKKCLTDIMEYSSDMHNIMKMLQSRLSEERIGTFQYVITNLKIQDATFGSFLRAFLTGRKLVSVNDLLKVKSIANSQVGQALKYSFLVEYYNKKGLDKKDTGRTYDNIIKNIIESDSEKLDTKTISDKCLREITILSGDFDGKRIISSLREIDDFNKHYSIEDFQSKKYGNDNNNITTACITKGNKCIGYIQIYRLFGTIKGMFNK